LAIAIFAARSIFVEEPSRAMTVTAFWSESEADRGVGDVVGDDEVGVLADELAGVRLAESTFSGEGDDERAVGDAPMSPGCRALSKSAWSHRRPTALIL
jgi:hypothetical protein